MEKRQYRVLPGEYHGGRNEYGPGDIVELTEEEAQPLLGWRLEPVEVDPKPAPPVAPDETDPKPAPKRKEKAS